jgi:sugar/nucleoside kinase (ribokinase family)
MKAQRFIALGDIVTDAFIKLQKAEIKKDLQGDKETITLPFGDKIPYESVEVVHAVGNSANAAVSAARLGLDSTLITDLGDDQNGKDCIESLKSNRVNLDYLSVHEGQGTNYHYVLWYENDRTILVKHERYEYSLPAFEAPDWIYLSSLGEHSLKYHQEIADYLRSHKEVSLAFQPGTYQMSFDLESMKPIYEETRIFFSNIEEAERILGIDTLGTEELLKRMHELGPKTVVLTDGPKGAYAYDGNEMWFIPTYPDPKPPFERTGAGDAFASTTVVALSLGKDLPRAMMWGAINSMSVVQHVGAQKGLLRSEEIERFMKEAPGSFTPQKLN